MLNISAHEIAITMISGRADDEDTDRAKLAAAQFLSNAGVTVADAAAEYRRQWQQFDDEKPMTGLARTWVDAGRAADLALTEGWADPNGASCNLDAAD